MAKAKRKTLPKEFEGLLKQGNLAELKAVFDSCDVNARGGVGKHTALAFDDCPDELARWLVEQGADLTATDTWGNTPLHKRSRSRNGHIQGLLALGADVHAMKASLGTPLHAAADSHNAANAALLIKHGARVDGKNRAGLTPLELALRSCANIDIEPTVPLARLLLEAGAEKTETAKGFVAEIGKRFEFHRAGFNPEGVDAASHALDDLYRLFDVPPVPRREIHDGKSPIVPRASTWQKQHQELWELLVPSSGPAATVQGEVIRISGRLSHEVLDNGGGNWDHDFRTMASAFLALVRSGKALPTEQDRECEAIVKGMPNQGDDACARLAKLAVSWVLLNPTPAPLPKPAYKR